MNSVRRLAVWLRATSPMSMAAKTAALYVVISAAWILYSDTVITWIAHDVESLRFLSSVKGLFFVVVTGLLLLLHLRRSFSAISDADYRADNARLESAGAREALRVSEDRWKLVVGNIRDYAVYLLDALGRVASWNEGARRIFGFAPEEIIGQPFDILFTKAACDDGVPRAELRKALETGEAESESTRIRKDGSQVITRTITSALHASDGTLRGYVEIVQDITERRRALDALKESEARYRYLFEANPQPMWVYRGSDLRFLAVNSAAVAHYGYTTKEFLNMTVLDIRPPEDRARFRESLEKQNDSVLRNVGLLCHRTKDGKIIDVHITANAMFFGGEPAQLVLVKDVTEQLQAERNLKHSHAQLLALTSALQQSMEEERSRIAREIHDDLGQRYAALNMDLALLARHIGHVTDPAMRATALQDISTSRKLLDEVVESTRKIIRDLRPEVLDSLGLVSGIAWQAAETERRHGIRCATDLPAFELPADPRVSTAIFRIAQEALMNVVRHSGATEVRISLSQVNGSFRLEVGDNGRGMKPEDREKLNSFGLLGMRERAFALGGTFEIHSSPGSGTRLVVSVPMTTSQEQS